MTFVGVKCKWNHLRVMTYNLYATKCGPVLTFAGKRGAYTLSVYHTEWWFASVVAAELLCLPESLTNLW